MVETDGPDKNQSEDLQDDPPAAAEAAQDPGRTPAEDAAAPEPPEEGAMIRSPSQEVAAIEEATASPEGAQAEGDTEAEPAPDWEAQYEKTRNQLLRVAADFENFKKRSKRDLTDVANRARDEVLQELLPVIDNLERAIEHADTAAECVDPDTLLEGVRMVMRQFESSMERFSVKAFDSVGQPFDPNFHEALQQRESDEVPPGHVLEEFRKGYMMGDRLVRPAMVVVAAAPTGNGEGEAVEDAGDASEDPASGDSGGTEEERSGK